MDHEADALSALLDAITGEGVVGAVLSGAAGWIILQVRRINRRLNAAYRLALVQTPVIEDIAQKLGADPDHVKEMMLEYELIERDRTQIGVKLPG